MSSVANGKYTITNARYTNSAVDINGGNPYSPITGYAYSGHAVQQWNLINIGGNKVVIQSAHTLTYATVGVELDGPPLSGSPNATIWVLHNVSSNIYRITTADGKYAWHLLEDGNYAPIVIKPVNANDTSSQWKLTSV